MADRKDYPVYGLWEVTTEGDCEGRSTRNLGTHEGYVDEIAFALADKSYYALKFRLVEPLDLKKTTERATLKTVNVGFAIDSGSWDLRGESLQHYWQELLAERGVTVLGSGGYAAVEIARNKDVPIILNERTQKELDRTRRDEERRHSDQTLERQRKEALAKIPMWDRQLLGIK